MSYQKAAGVVGLVGAGWGCWGLFGTSWDVGARWADLRQAGRSGGGNVWGCWVSLKLAGGGLGLVGQV